MNIDYSSPPSVVSLPPVDHSQEADDPSSDVWPVGQ